VDVGESAMIDISLHRHVSPGVFDEVDAQRELFLLDVSLFMRLMKTEFRLSLWFFACYLVRENFFK